MRDEATGEKLSAVLPGLEGLDYLDVYVPEFRASIDKTRKPCRLATTLLAIYYDGDNVGSQWLFSVSVNGQVWVPSSGPITLQHRGTRSFNTQVYEERREAGCGLAHIVSIFLRARELDWLLFDDIGERLELTTIMCSEEGSQRLVVVIVPVPEFPYCRRISRRERKTALLYFYLQLEAQCVE